MMIADCASVQLSIEILGLVFTIFAGGWALWQWRHDKKDRCADVYGQLLASFASDGIFLAFEDLIEKTGIADTDVDQKGKLRDSALDQLDRLLMFLNQICYLYENHMIGEKEFQTFRYPLSRTLGTGKVLQYMETMQKEAADDFMYDSLMAYADALGKTSEDICAGMMSEEMWRDYLIKHYGGWTHTAQSVYARVSAVCKKTDKSVDQLVKTIDIANQNINDIPRWFADKSAAQISSLRTAVRHCCKAKHGVWPES